VSKKKQTAKVREQPAYAYGSRSTALLARKHIEPREAIKHISKGLPFGELEHLRSDLDEPMEVLARQLSISRSTLQRRKTERRLSPEESDRVMRFWRIVKYATNLFGTLDRARLWLKFPQFGLGGAVPLEFAKTETGAREVEDLLGRIDYGVYS
jgi:putative toxin-antitoxin system antitoxin component (TIGR02293 family)